MAVQIQLRRDAAADWTSANPTLKAGEIGYETDTARFKIGDGATAWTSLQYYYQGVLFGCRVKQTAPTALTSSWVTCNFGAEDFDTDGMHDNSTNPERITIVTTGKYVVGGVVQVAANALSGARVCIHNADGDSVMAQQKQGNSGDPEGASVVTIFDCVAGDYFYLQGYAGTSNNSSGDEQTNFWAYRVGV